MLQISAAERAYVEEGVRVGVRADGRGRLDYRFFTLETGLITQANGMLVDHSKKKKKAKKIA
jgi:exosome complex component RRP42